MSPKYFRLLLVVSWVAAIAGIVLNFATETLLPENLQLYLETEGEVSSDGEWLFAWALWLAWLASFGAALVTDIGLYFFKLWAKKLLPWTLIAGFVLIPFHPPTIEHSLVTALFYLVNLMCGAIFALVYFSPLAERFESPPRL